jgi:uncharacterized caspase-like protein
MCKPAIRFRLSALLRVLSLILTTLASLALMTPPASAAKRVALVVGNSAYRSVPALPNPANDAASMRRVLEATGFDVIHVADASSATFRTTLEAFAKAVEQAGQGSAAVVYYAGHAVQLEGTNYLLPIDAKPRSDADIRSQSISLRDILKRLDETGAATKIVILDACRDNPFAPEAGARGLAATLLDGTEEKSEHGLARVESKGGTLVAFATSPGAQAADGAGEHSPYTAALLNLLPEPGLPVEQLFRRVRLSVHDTTSGLQTPWETSSLITDFSFVAATVAPKTAASVGSTARLASARPTREALRALPAEEAYRTVVFWNEPEIYRVYLEIYPDDLRALWIHRTLALRYEEIAWAEAVQMGDADSFRLFQRLYPGSLHGAEALRLASTSAPRAVRMAALCGPTTPTPTRGLTAPTRKVEKPAPTPPKAKPERPERKAEKAPAPKPQRNVRIRQPIETAEEPVVRAPPAFDPGAAIAIGVIGGALIGGTMDRGPRIVRPRPYPYPDGGMGPSRPRPYPDGGVGRGGFQPNRDMTSKPLGNGSWQSPRYVPR